LVDHCLLLLLLKDRESGRDLSNHGRQYESGIEESGQQDRDSANFSVGKITMKFGVTLAALSAILCTPAFAATPVAEHGALSVNGVRVVDARNRPVALVGVSFFWSNTGYGQERFYNTGAVHSFAKDWNVSLIRAAMGAEGTGSYKTDPQINKARVRTLVDAAIEEGIYVIIDWHSYSAHEDDPQLAITFFTEIAREYGRYPNIIYEIYNEPMKVSWKDQVKPYAERVIDAIRAIDSSNLIIVGSPEWDHDVDVAASDPITARKNVVYSLHFYAGSHKEELRQKAARAMALGAPLFVSEWGSVNSDGGGPVDTDEVARWQKFVRDNCLSQAAFAVSDKAESTSIFKAGVSASGPWKDSDLTSSGQLIRNLFKSAPRTCIPISNRE